MRAVRITAGGVSATAALNDSKTAEAVWSALPITARASTWGDEIYFSIPVKAGEENGRATVEMGDLGYWPPGSAFCIFFGPTPASQTADEIRPASPVNVFGKVDGDATVFKNVRSGETVTVEKA
ncbi:MAG TPA: cyclophilin-like fold protein [Chloroflexota bacterium]|nr:cyclophilin-like fold protein [Chloroflexota bacterium]